MYQETSILKIFKKMMASTLVILVLFSGTGFSLDAHFCGDDLKSWNLYGKADECPMDMDRITVQCPVHANMSITMPANCCDNQHIEVAPQNHEAFIYTYTSINPEFINSENIEYPEVLLSLVENNYYSQNRPPPINKDLIVLIQSYLL